VARGAAKALHCGGEAITLGPCSEGQFLKRQGNKLVGAQVAGGGSAWGEITGTLSSQTDLQGALDGKEDAGTAASAVSAHEVAGDPHTGYLTAAEADAAYEEVGAVAAHEALADPHPGYLTPSEGNAAYEPKNANIQAHVAQAHAPANAQKNSDITKAEIESVLTGQIDTHSHAGGAGGSPMLVVPLVADGAAVALTNMALALGFLAASHRFATKIDLTNFTQVRLVVNKQATAGAAAAKIILRYRTAFDATPANWSDIGASEVSVAINVQNTVLSTAWINLAASAKADVFVCPLMSGGDGALDPTIGAVSAQFK
jgi:hypothetical protein